ncbi:uncharacterized transposon-derived protein F54H12.3 [Trichonephila inaurata madagascariensis]|uniref:Uncharacterized transposon-derived protein F54H12.3 n=1 Tax=Trichonephila inaurata madagascariensis TaxID=2747483 RepID=A0A8X6XCI3_9ARAC|nr:uncharacterized transposon-derived protein F54H12.3 [Trichonephila inaurata madagascariensis]
MIQSYFEDKMWKYFTEMNTKCYIDVVGKLMYSYNHTWHRSIRMEPSSVSEGNQTQVCVWLTLYGKSMKESKSIFKVGDTGTFYPQELQKVSDSGFYPVENVIKTRKRNGKSEYLVKFQGYPEKFNAWVLNLVNIKKSVESPYIADPTASFSIMYAYCDLVEPQIVGHIQAPLLKIIKVEGKDGEVVNAHYTRPHYVPVIQQQFQTIEMILRLHSGDLVPFERVRVIVVLHFRLRQII